MRVHQLSSPVESLVFQSYRTWGSVFQPPNTCCFKAFCKGVQISPKQRCLDHFGRLGNSWKNLPFFGPKKTGEIFSTTKHPILVLVFGGFRTPKTWSNLRGHQFTPRNNPWRKTGQSFLENCRLLMFVIWKNVLWQKMVVPRYELLELVGI